MVLSSFGALDGRGGRAAGSGPLETRTYRTLQPDTECVTLVLRRGLVRASEVMAERVSGERAGLMRVVLEGCCWCVARAHLLG